METSMKLIFFLVSLASCLAIREPRRGVPAKISWNIHRFCFRRLNDTHQIGCSSDQNGNVGVLHRVLGAKDVDYIVETGPQTKYVAIVDDVDLDRDDFDRFAESQRVAGVLVLQTEREPEASSTDETCPNRQTSGYKNSTTCQYNSITNNRASSMMTRAYPFPMFLLQINSSAVDSLMKCFEEFNKDTLNSSPFQVRKCAVRMYSPMNAVHSTQLCMRRSAMASYFTATPKFCEPLEGMNIMTSMPSKLPVEKEKNTILIICRLDTFSLFDGVAPGADSAVSGTAALLSTARTLTALKEMGGFKFNKNIVFAMFNGEAFDYIGSSRFVHQLKNQDATIKLRPEDIAAVIEFNQIFLFGNSTKWYAHVDQAQYDSDPEIKETLDALVDGFNGTIVKRVDYDLPPVSIRMFLRDFPQIPSLVVTNFAEKFTNRFYNSMFDAYGFNIKPLDLRNESLHLVRLVESVVRSVTTLATVDKRAPDRIMVDDIYIGQLLECYLTNSNCSLFRAVVDDYYKRFLVSGPLPLYVSVSNDQHLILPSTLMTYRNLIYATGSVVPYTFDQKACSAYANEHPLQQFTWMFGEEPNKTHQGICVEHLCTKYYARSPAFDDNMTAEERARYSTWTESVWSVARLSLFVQTAGMDQLVTLVVGILMASVTAIIGYLFVQRLDELIQSPAPAVRNQEASVPPPPSTPPPASTPPPVAC